MVGGGPFQLLAGEWTDDTSMALCLAESLIEKRGFDPMDQLERYTRWAKHGHLSSNGRVFDIGGTVRAALAKFAKTHEPYCGSSARETDDYAWPAVEISYSGSKAPLDPLNVEEMLRLLDSGLSVSHMATGSQDRFREVANRLRQYIRWDRIPVAFDERDYHYFTFAGQLVNSTVARWAEVTSFDAGEIVLRSQTPIDSSKLPADPHDLRLTARQGMLAPENLSIFQQLLPRELLAWIIHDFASEKRKGALKD